jgi:hypothetical protein
VSGGFPIRVPRTCLGIASGRVILVLSPYLIEPLYGLDGTRTVVSLVAGLLLVIVTIGIEAREPRNSVPVSACGVDVRVTLTGFRGHCARSRLSSSAGLSFQSQVVRDGYRDEMSEGCAGRSCFTTASASSMNARSRCRRHHGLISRRSGPLFGLANPQSGDQTPVFHPAVTAWFATHFASPTLAQAQAWPAIQAGRHTLIAAPTGSGKTLAAFLAAIDGLVRQGLDGGLPDATQVVYVSPLKALSNDIQRNLELPLAGIRAQLRQRGLPDVEIRTSVRTGDTPTAERNRMHRRPPHILVTTPESLYILLGSASGRAMLGSTRTVIVDEIHAMAPNERGAHLALSLERLAALCGDRLVRIGLSATQNPIDAIAQLLVGAAPATEVTIVDTGHHRERDLRLDVPDSPLEAVIREFLAACRTLRPRRRRPAEGAAVSAVAR